MRKAKIDFYGTSEILKKLEQAGADVEIEIKNALHESGKIPKQQMLDYIKKHELTGTTEKSFGEETKSKNGKIEYRLGFSIKDGGLPTIFLNYGTPRIKPSFFVDKAIDENIDSIIQSQQDALNEAFKELL